MSENQEEHEWELNTTQSYRFETQTLADGTTVLRFSKGVVGAAHYTSTVEWHVEPASEYQIQLRLQSDNHTRLRFMRRSTTRAVPALLPSPTIEPLRTLGRGRGANKRLAASTRPGGSPITPPDEPDRRVVLSASATALPTRRVDNDNFIAPAPPSAPATSRSSSHVPRPMASLHARPASRPTSTSARPVQRQPSRPVFFVQTNQVFPRVAHNSLHGRVNWAATNDRQEYVLTNSKRGWRAIEHLARGEISSQYALMQLSTWLGERSPVSML
jgi:hypothetical protein